MRSRHHTTSHHAQRPTARGSNRGSNARRTAAIVDALESRVLLATFSGTAGPDTIVISAGSRGSTRVQVNGNVHVTSDTTVAVAALGGDDAIQVAGTPASKVIRVSGGDGNDTLSNTVGDLDAVYRSDFAFDGGAGDDLLVADNSADATAGSHLILQGNGVVKDGVFLVSTRATEALAYGDSDHSNRIDLLNLASAVDPAADVRATVLANGGDDLITNFGTLPGTGGLDNVIGSRGLVIDGGTGNDTLALDNHLDGDGDVYTVKPARFEFGSPSDPTALTYGGVESFELTCADSGDVVRLIDKPDAMTLRVDTGGGDDAVRYEGGDIDDSGFIVATTTLLGGTGEDSVEFDDRLDSTGVRELEAYTFDNFTLAKLGDGFTYGGFEAQTLRTADRVPAGTVPVGNTVNLDAVGGTIDRTTIDGGSVRRNVVNVGRGSLANVGGTLVLDLNAAGGRVNVNDQDGTGDADYALTATQLRKSTGGVTQLTAEYGDAGGLTLNANQGDNVVLVQGTPAGTAVAVNGGGGDDAFDLGNGNLAANLLGPVTVNGGTGFDNRLLLSNNLDAAPSAQALDGLSFTEDGLTHTASFVAAVRVDTGPGGGVLDVVRSAVPTTIHGSRDRQVVNVGGGNLDANLLADVSVVSAAAVNVDDRLDAGDDVYLVDLDAFRKQTPGAQAVRLGAGVAAAALLANDGNNTIQVSNARGNVRLFGNGGNDHVSVDATAPSDAVETVGIDTGTEVPAGPGGGDRVTVNADAGTRGTRGAAVRLLATDAIHQLTVNAGGTFRVPDGAAADLTGPVALTGVIDVAGGTVVVRGTAPQFETFDTFVGGGFNGGAWDGTTSPAGGAINSSLAASTPERDGVGLAAASSVFGTFPAPFAGLSVNADDLLLTFTLSADANLDRRVDVADLGILATHFNRPGRWDQGDCTFDGVVDVADLGVLATNFNRGPAAAAGTRQQPGAANFGFGAGARSPAAEVCQEKDSEAHCESPAATACDRTGQRDPGAAGAPKPLAHGRRVPRQHLHDERTDHPRGRG
jgi:hypothetical protein